MEFLAVELLTSIFSLACTDGGRTACSLSLVCKHIREVARPIRFNVVALTGGAPHKLQAFFDDLERESNSFRAGTTSRVRHLFLHTDLSKARTQNSGGSSKDARQSEAMTPAQYSDLVTSILQAVSPHLETLVLLPYPYSPSMLEGVIFPCLRELALQTSDRHLDLGPTDSSPAYPSLRRLHLLSGGFNVDLWAHHSPSLTHLRISNFSDHVYLDGLMHLQDPEGPFPELEKIIIHPIPPPPPRWCHGAPLVRYRLMIPALWASQAPTRVPVYILPPNVEKREYTRYIQDHRQEWGDYVEGRRPGCWDVSEDYARGNVKSNIPPLYLAPWIKPAIIEE
ncbi:hypothetical protein C8Q79DRAFT_631352 [Trametes meyenii]|nr:hypothetical protein C8Q79DRAFT_631352 [Trametes meyenii]